MIIKLHMSVGSRPKTNLHQWAVYMINLYFETSKSYFVGDHRKVGKKYFHIMCHHISK